MESDAKRHLWRKQRSMRVLLGLLILSTVGIVAGIAGISLADARSAGLAESVDGDARRGMVLVLTGALGVSAALLMLAGLWRRRRSGRRQT